MAKKRSSSGEGEPPNKKPTSNNKNKTDFSTIDFSAKDGDFKVKEGMLKLINISSEIACSLGLWKVISLQFNGSWVA